GSGQTFSVWYERHWNSSSSAEGEFPPVYRLEVNVPNECNNGNNRMDRRSDVINRMFGDVGRGGGGALPIPGDAGRRRVVPNIVRFFAIDDKPGQPPALCYLVTGATSARIDQGVGPIRLSNQQDCITVRPQRTTTYTLITSSPDGRDDAQATVE